MEIFHVVLLMLKTSILYCYRHVANGEILGVTLLMEDVLQTGFQDVSLLTDHAGNGDPDKQKERKARSGSVKATEQRRISTPQGSVAKISKLNI